MAGGWCSRGVLWQSADGLEVAGTGRHSIAIRLAHVRTYAAGCRRAPPATPEGHPIATRTATSSSVSRPVLPPVALPPPPDCFIGAFRVQGPVERPSHTARRHSRTYLRTFV